MTRPPPVPLRPLGVAEILDGAVRLVRADVRPALAIALPIATVAAGLEALLRLALLDASGAATVVFLLGLVVSSGLGVLLTGLLTPMYTARILGSPIDGPTTLRRVGRRAWSLVLLALLVAIGQCVGLALLLVPGIWLWGVWAVAAPAAVQEGLGVGGALRRSYRLVRDSFWRTWGLRAVGSLLTSIMSLIVTVPFEALASVIADVNPFDTTHGVPNSTTFVLVTALGSLVAGTLVSPIRAAIDLLIYTDLRMRREGMDIVMGLPPAPAGSAAPVSAW